MKNNLVPCDSKTSALATLKRYKEEAHVRKSHGLFSWYTKFRRKLAEWQLLPILQIAAFEAITVESRHPLTVRLNYSCVFTTFCFERASDPLPSVLSQDELLLAGVLLSKIVLRRRFPDVEFEIVDVVIPGETCPPGLGFARQYKPLSESRSSGFRVAPPLLLWYPPT